MGLGLREHHKLQRRRQGDRIAVDDTQRRRSRTEQRPEQADQLDVRQLALSPGRAQRAQRAHPTPQQRFGTESSHES